MVYERYVKKGDKIYGPYKQHNKKVDGKVVTEYRGKSASSVNGFNNTRLFLFGLLGLIFIFSLIAFANFNLTGKVSLDIKSKYVEGENLEGNLKFSLKEGELIPLDSKIVLQLGDEVQEYFLSEFITLEVVDGFFYAEDTNLFGEGLGYGLIGSKKIYPDVNFDLEIFDSVDEKSGGSGSSGGVKNSVDTGGDVGEIIPEVEESTPNRQVGPEEVGPEEGVSQGGTSSSSSPSVDEDINTEGKESGEISLEKSIETEAVDSSEGTSDKSNKKVDKKEDKKSLKSESSSSGGSILTGEVILENVVSGAVSKDNDFEYEYGKSKAAKLVEGSVIVNGNVVDEDILEVNLEKDKVVVSTDYYYEEEGFGEDYLGKKKLKFTINLEEFDLVVGEDSHFSVKLISEDIVLVEASKDLKISENDTLSSKVHENETEEVEDELIINETEIEIVVNNTLLEYENLTRSEAINFTGIGLDINTTQYGAVLNRPVKWKKNIKLDKIGDISIELPKQAENISVYKIVEGEREELAPNGVPSVEEDINTEGKELEQSEDNLIIEESLENQEEKAKTGDFVQEPINETIEIIEENITEIEESIAESENVTIVGVPVSVEKEFNKTKISITAKVISGEVSIEIEEESSFASLFRKIFSVITGRVVYVEEEEEFTEIFIEDNAIEYEIDYETPGPVASETTTIYGKEIVISSDVHYENILAYSILPYEVPEGIIKMYWVTTKNITSINNQTNETIIEFVDVRKPIDVVGYDLNNNSLVDYVEWIVPSLSNQTYELVIEISKAEHLDENRTFISNIYEVSIKDNIWSKVINDREYVRVMFGQNLTSKKDITIYARGNGSIEVYVKDGNESIAVFSPRDDPEGPENISRENWYKIYLTNVNGTSDVFDLKILGKVEFDYIVGPFEPLVNRFIIRNLIGDDIASIDDKGEMYLKGVVFQNQGPLNPPSNSFIVENSSGHSIAYFNNSGFLFLAGAISISSDLSGQTSTNLEFRNSTEDLVAFFDNQGNLKLKGEYIENYANP